MSVPDLELLERFAAIVGTANALWPGETDLTPYTQENRHIFEGRTPLVLRPGNTQEVAAIMRLAFETGTAVVPQGGHTGHAGGGAPDDSGGQIVVVLTRMNRLREVDLAGSTMTVEAGMVLQQAQEIADRHDRLFPLALGSQGSCQIGGNISTNAGGTGVIAHGNMREQVIGLEVVLPNGEVWNGLRKLRKDNTGYALKQLFIGAEGTLGIVTAAVLRLLPKPKGREVAYVAVESPRKALDLLNLAQGQAGPALTAFELIHRTPMTFALKHGTGARDPFGAVHDWYVLAEISSGRSAGDARALAESIFGEALEGGLALDVVLAENLGQQAAFWKLREDMVTAQPHEGGSIKNDISVPVHLIPEFLEQAGLAVAAAMPDARIVAFGHMGDGNLHYNISQPEGGDARAFLARREEINALVNTIVLSLDGSISAEHGIGRLKRDLLAATKSPVEMAMMRAVKQALDPTGIMNPGKVV
ncbi:MAG: FAD-binding oxidoreductase [Pseudomonadota bacterium]|nr:FAD-binding oxidoreductase [Pseudomonadota bacterium]